MKRLLQDNAIVLILSNFIQHDVHVSPFLKRKLNYHLHMAKIVNLAKISFCELPRVVLCLLNFFFFQDYIQDTLTML